MNAEVFFMLSGDQQRFDQAILKVDAVLAKAPGYADALFLKASILWEGFNEPIEAKVILVDKDNKFVQYLTEEDSMKL